MMVFDNDRYHNPEGEYKKQWYLLKCEGDILDKFQSFIIKAIEPFYSKEKRLNKMSDSLVPIIDFENLENYETGF